MIFDTGEILGTVAGIVAGIAISYAFYTLIPAIRRARRLTERLDVEREEVEPTLEHLRRQRVIEAEAKLTATPQVNIDAIVQEREERERRLPIEPTDPDDPDSLAHSTHERIAQELFGDEPFDKSAAEVVAIASSFGIAFPKFRVSVELSNGSTVSDELDPQDEESIRAFLLQVKAARR